MLSGKHLPVRQCCDRLGLSVLTRSTVGLAGTLAGLIQAPVLNHSLHSVPKIAEVDWFYEKGCGAQAVGSVDVVNIPGGSENDDANRREARLRAQPLQNFEAVCARHFKIEQQDVGER